LTRLYKGFFLVIFTFAAADATPIEFAPFLTAPDDMNLLSAGIGKRLGIAGAADFDATLGIFCQDCLRDEAHGKKCNQR
jgi:hypothetical protein